MFTFKLNLFKWVTSDRVSVVLQVNCHHQQQQVPLWEHLTFTSKLLHSDRLLARLRTSLKKRCSCERSLRMFESHDCHCLPEGHRHAFGTGANMSVHAVNMPKECQALLTNDVWQRNLWRALIDGFVGNEVIEFLEFRKDTCHVHTFARRRCVSCDHHWRWPKKSQRHQTVVGRGSAQMCVCVSVGWVENPCVTLIMVLFCFVVLLCWCIIVNSCTDIINKKGEKKLYYICIMFSRQKMRRGMKLKQ